MNVRHLVLAALLFSTLPAAAQDAKTIGRAVTFLKQVPPRVTSARLKKLLPKGTNPHVTRSAGATGWTWIVQPFSGSLNGQFVFANQRKPPARKPGMPPPPPFDGANQWLLPTDQLHYVEIFLGAPSKTKGAKGALTAETKRFVDALTKSLGKPAKQENTGEAGGPDATGWTAQWNLSGGRRLEFINDFALLTPGERPLLRLTFPYSKIYKP